MKLQNLSLEQLKEIVEGAPDGAVWVALDEPSFPYFYDSYFKFWNGSEWTDTGYIHRTLSASFLCVIKLSDIRARINEFEPAFKVGDRVVIVNPKAVSSLFEVVYTHSSRVHVKEINIIDYGMQFFDPHQIRHATPEEEAAGHRIDEPSSSCGMTAAEIDQFGEDLRSKPYVDFPEFEQPDTITTQLDPAKCRVVDPALPYDEPAKRRVGWVGCLGFGAIGNALQGNQSNFDAMSESHRSPGCKCQEFPFDAELKPDPTNRPCKAAKKIKKLKKRIAQLERDCQFSELKAEDLAHKYWDSVRDNACLYSALEEVFAERAAEYEAEIERLKGEQGE